MEARYLRIVTSEPWLQARAYSHPTRLVRVEQISAYGAHRLLLCRSWTLAAREAQINDSAPEAPCRPAPRGKSLGWLLHGFCRYARQQIN